MKNLKSLPLIATTVLFTFLLSCEKSELAEPNGTEPVIEAPAPTEKGETIVNKSADRPSLAEFAAIVDTEEEINFFANTSITDNTPYVINAIGSGNPSLRIQAGFKWHGKGGTGSGCKKPLGICLIIVFGAPPAELNVDAMVYENKYVLLFENGQTDNGLTSDGYMPILRDVYVDATTTIKAGIYKANFDPSTGQYIGVAVDVL